MTSLRSGLPLELSGVPADLVSLAIQEPYSNRPARVYFGTTDTTTPPFPEGSSVAVMDVMDIEDGAETQAQSR